MGQRGDGVPSSAADSGGRRGHGPAERGVAAVPAGRFGGDL
ncbi:hypothetical protein [Streptomyces sp. PR69]|nr:hypothetical protein [Streptomyces sp. PR69]